MTTLQTGANGAHSWTPPIGTLGPDVGELTSPTPPANGKEPISAADFHYDTTGQDEGNWWCTFREFRNGYAQEGPIEQMHASLSESELDGSAVRQITLPLSLTQQATPDPDAAQYWSIFWTYAFGQLVVGISALADTYLYGETSSTNPALVLKTYSKGYQMTGVANINLLGQSYLGVLKALHEIELLSDFGSTPTSFHSMDAATVGATAALTTPLGNTLIWVNGSVLDLPKGSAYNAVPNTVLSGVYGIAGLIGYGSIAGRQSRVYLMGQRTITQSPIGSGLGLSNASLDANYAVWDGQIESFDFTGNDRQVFDIGLDRIRGADFYREGMIAHDGSTMNFRGRVARTLNIQGGRKRNSDREPVIAGFFVRKRGELFLIMNEVASPNGTGNTKMWLEAYDWDSDSCTPITKKVTISATGVQTYASARGLPISPQTGYFHQRVGPNTGTASANGSWYRYKRPPVDQTPYDQRQTVGAGASTGSTFDNTDSAAVTGEVNATSPELWFPSPLYAARKTVTGAFYGGALEGTAEAKIAAGGRTFHFYGPGSGVTGNERSRFDTEGMEHGDGGSEFLHLQYVLTLLQGTGNGFTTPQAGPFRLWGRWYGSNSKNGWET